jgi:hypothetical protein
MQMLLAVLVALAPVQQTAATMEANDALFLKLTTEVNRALQAKDGVALDRILAKDFAFSMFREGKTPQVMNRSEAIQTVGMWYTLEQFEIRYLAARVLGSAAVVRFQPLRKAELGTRDRSGEFAVVDIWLKDGSEWRLSSRYQSRPDPGVPAP